MLLLNAALHLTPYHLLAACSVRRVSGAMSGLALLRALRLNPLEQVE